MLTKYTTVARELKPTADGAELHLVRVPSARLGPFGWVSGGIGLGVLLSLGLPDIYREIVNLLWVCAGISFLGLVGLAFVLQQQPPEPFSLELRQGKLLQVGLPGPKEFSLVELVKMVQFQEGLTLYSMGGKVSSIPLPPSDLAKTFVIMVRQQHEVAQEARALAEAGRREASALLQRIGEPEA